MNPSTKYRLRALNPEMLLYNQNRQQAKSLIELNPADRSYFEIISFIEFCYASEKQFSSSDVIKRNDKNIEIFLFIKNPINTYQSTNYAFHVLISQNLLFIKLFVKNLLYDLKIIEENDDIFIEFNNGEIKIDELICPSGKLKWQTILQIIDIHVLFGLVNYFFNIQKKQTLYVLQKVNQIKQLNTYSIYVLVR